MIVVVGRPGYRAADGGQPDAAIGLAADIARAAVAAGSRVELVGKVGDDAAGDALVLALAREGVGHAALLRDPSRGTPVAIDGHGSGTDEDPTEEAADELPELVLPEDPGQRPALDAGDLALALQYLTDYAVVVVADELDDASARVVSDAADFAGAHAVAVAAAGTVVPDTFASATVFEAPPTDPEHAFAGLVAGYAAAIDAGTPPSEAFEHAVKAAGWQSVEA